MARNFITASSQHISFPVVTVSELGTVFTIAARVRNTLLDGTLKVIMSDSSLTASDKTAFQFSMLATNKFRFVLVDDAINVADLASTNVASLNTWESLVGVRNGSAQEFFIGGASEDTAAISLGTLTDIDTFNVGARTQGTSTRVDYFDGDIADLAIWTVVLTQNEITAYNNGVSPTLIRPDKLIRYIPLWGTTQEGELTGTGDTGTLVNTPVISTTVPPVGLYKKRTVFNQGSLKTVGFCINGIVKEDGSNVARTVRVYLSSTGALLGETISNASTGVYQICNIASAAEVFVIAFDDSAGDSFNAEIFDKVIPVLG